MTSNFYHFKKQHTSTKALPYRKLPGHVLIEDFVAPYGSDLATLSKRAKIPLRRLHKLIRGEDRIDDRMAESLAKFFGNDVEFWLDIQKRYEQGTLE